ncbi:hypothetical protein LTR85_006071 [Meristemomyces frigidus]|nr:hypothetical protein LTR85_006071 [Meristemomyces frigidus]
MPGRGRSSGGRGGSNGNNAGRNNSQNSGSQGRNNNNNDQQRCHTCNKTGHIAENCRSNGGSNGDAMNIDSNNGSPITCHICGVAGHKANACPTKQRGSGQQNNASSRGAKWCDFHKNSSHSDADCNDPRNTQGPKSKGAPSGGFSTGHNVYSNWDQVNVTSQQAYCPLCNVQGHWERDCSKKGVVDIRYSPQICWKCHLRAHTGDECRNPANTACEKCRKSGHATASCKDTSSTAELRAKLYEQTAGWAAAANVSRFAWDPTKTQITLSPLQVEQRWQK